METGHQGERGTYVYFDYETGVPLEKLHFENELDRMRRLSVQNFVVHLRLESRIIPGSSILLWGVLFRNHVK